MTPVFNGFHRYAVGAEFEKFVTDFWGRSTAYLHLNGRTISHPTQCDFVGVPNPNSR